MISVLDKVLGAARQLGASDVHLKVGLPPIFRVKGDLRTVANVPPLTQEAIEEFGFSMMNRAPARHLREELGRRSRLLHAGRLPLPRERAAAAGMHGGGHAPHPAQRAALRAAEPAAARCWSWPRRSAASCWSPASPARASPPPWRPWSTTSTRTRAVHIVTIEDPIEFAFKDRRSVINQREIGFDTTTFARALRASLRQDPDVIFVGEMRDIETTEIAMTAAETGHLVLSTLHTIGRGRNRQPHRGALPAAPAGAGAHAALRGA